MDPELGSSTLNCMLLNNTIYQLLPLLQQNTEKQDQIRHHMYC